MRNAPKRTKVRAILAIACTVLALAGCSGLNSKNPVPDPAPDHGANVEGQPGQLKVTITVHDRNGARAERIVTGTAKALGVGNKPIVIRDEKTGHDVPAVIPFRARSIDGEAYLLATYHANTVTMRLDFIIQGYGGDAALMDIEDALGNEIGWAHNSVDYCEITRPPTQMGACVLFADIIVKAP